jgi:exopolyphosphatase/guanosine-5'-triphosphate,3'-diphosphate pyrophosphatase
LSRRRTDGWKNGRCEPDNGQDNARSVSALASSPARHPDGAKGSGLAALNGASRPYSRISPLPALSGLDVSKHIYAALDLGTNNCRLLVARPSRRGFLVIDAFSRIIRLGEGLSHSGALSEEAMARTIEALRICAAKMQRRGVTRSRLIATEACRIASNGAEFISRVQRETGLRLEIISQETEARLAVSGCASLIDKACDFALIFDIGGGSSEFVWLNLLKSSKLRRVSLQNRVRMQDCIEAWTSLRLGVVTLADRFGGRQVDEAAFERMVAFVMEHLAAFEARYGIAARMAGRKSHLLGTSGTVTTIAGIFLGLPAYDRAKVDGCWLSAGDIRAVSRKIMAMSHQERIAQPCIGPDRADLVLAGCAILEATLRAWPFDTLRVADRGLREGILTTLIAEDVLRQKRLKASLAPPGKGCAPQANTL